MRSCRSLLFVGLLLVVVGCDDDSSSPSGPDPISASAAPEFSLPDVNPNSATSGQAVNPRDHLQRVTAWYFGHAT